MDIFELTQQYLNTAEKTSFKMDGLEEQLLKSLFSGQEKSSDNVHEQLRQTKLNAVFATGKEKPGSEQTQQSLEQLFSELKQKIALSDPSQSTVDVVEIVSRLSRLKLLHGVPLQYLIPHELMLPEESIRFFQLDPNWCTALIDGAYSIGRTVEAIEVKGRELLESHSTNECQQVRDKQFGLTTPFSQLKRVPKITGCLLRSELLVDYPGLELRAFADKQALDPISTLRMERLHPSLLLCLFNGELNYLEIREPPEGIFLGFDKQNSKCEKFTKTLREPGAEGDEGMANRGDNLPGEKVDVPMRSDSDRVVDIAGLVDVLQQQQVIKKKVKQFTSADFALQMTRGVERVCLTTQSQ